MAGQSDFGGLPEVLSIGHAGRGVFGYLTELWRILHEQKYNKYD